MTIFNSKLLIYQRVCCLVLEALVGKSSWRLRGVAISHHYWLRCSADPWSTYNGLDDGKFYRKTPYLMVKTIKIHGFCKFSLKPIH